MNKEFILNAYLFFARFGLADFPPAMAVRRSPRIASDDTTSADQCETPFVAFRDVAPVLDFIAKVIGKSRAELKLWDPFVSEDRAARCLHELGFRNVIHET